MSARTKAESLIMVKEFVGAMPVTSRDVVIKAPMNLVSRKAASDMVVEAYKRFIHAVGVDEDGRLLGELPTVAYLSMRNTGRYNSSAMNTLFAELSQRGIRQVVIDFHLEALEQEAFKNGLVLLPAMLPEVVKGELKRINGAQSVNAPLRQVSNPFLAFSPMTRDEAVDSPGVVVAALSMGETCRRASELGVPAVVNDIPPCALDEYLSSVGNIIKVSEDAGTYNDRLVQVSEGGEVTFFVPSGFADEVAEREYLSLAASVYHVKYEAPGRIGSAVFLVSDDYFSSPLFRGLVSLWSLV